MCPCISVVVRVHVVVVVVRLFYRVFAVTQLSDNFGLYMVPSFSGFLGGGGELSD